MSYSEVDFKNKWAKAAGFLEWELLNSEARFLIDEITNKWQQLLLRRLSEETYQRFLNEHAALFFNNCLVISKFRLGSDYTPDFILAEDNRSDGITFNLIELETPWCPPFTKRGNPSARLTTALQQVQNWRRWLLDHRHEALKLFPAVRMRAYREPTFKFTVFIGDRCNSEPWLDRRHDLAERLSIKIRSFDSLTDVLTSQHFSDFVSFGCTEETELTELQRNQLANPFVRAYSDPAWRNLVKTLGHTTHFIVLNAATILKHRECNEKYSQFVARYGLVSELTK
jgi:hypothetical protein